MRPSGYMPGGRFSSSLGGVIVAGMAEVGDIVPSRRGWITVAPTRCPQLHPLGPQQVLVGHLACMNHQGGHTTWSCRECDAVIYGPPIDPLCSVVNGPAAVRNSFGSSTR